MTHAPDYLVAFSATTFGVDTHLDNIESLLIALRQRPMTDEQLDRYARLLQSGERDALRRVRRPDEGQAA
ncbi:MAG: hypothetical protein LC798_11200 [Chloroflexi bacterium]|nr:hypothetical protein [Chloroflexota bacterium]